MKKNGRRDGVQTYKCVTCGYKFQNKRRPQKLSKRILKQYVWKRQTLHDIGDKYDRSERWVQTRLKSVSVKPVVAINDRRVVIIADTTFFSRADGVTVFRNPHEKKNMWWRETAQENGSIYRVGKWVLEKNGFTIAAVVLDGRKGIREVFSGIPVQMCHFHQKQIVRRYLTNNPTLEAGRELKEIMKTLAYTTEEQFTRELNQWHETWEVFLKQRTVSTDTGRWFYTHKRLRAAYRSLRTNLPYLFTYQRYPELSIPNTTNSLDGFFNRLKSLLHVHRGCSRENRKKMMVEILMGNE